MVEIATPERSGTKERRRSMHVQVKLYSRFRELLPGEARGEATVQLPHGATVTDLLEHLGVSGRVKLITVNGERQSEWARPLNDGDRVRVLPFAVGG
jgi:sulfur carrier protein ThiS